MNPSIELRVVDYDHFEDPRFLRALEEIRPDAISIGSESCFRALPNLARLETIVGRFAGVRKKLVVPMLFESHFDEVRPFIQAALPLVDGFVVNDYGVLRLLEEAGGGKCPITLGSGVSYSYEECPWYDHILRAQPEAVKKGVLRSNLDNDWMYDVLGTFRSPLGVELPALAGMVGSADRLRQAGISVSVLANGVPVSCARACHAARYFDVDVDRCERVCRKRIVLHSTHRWDFFEGDVKEIAPEVREQMPALHVWGNLIYVENLPGTVLPALVKADNVVVDYKFFSDPDSLRAGVHEMRGQLGALGPAEC